MSYKPTTSISGVNNKAEIKKKIVNLLSNYNFKEADSIFLEYGDLYGFDINEYEKFKGKFLGEYFKDNYNLKFGYDSEQLESIASIHKNTLVTARAGSGKTQVIAGKTAYLFDSEKIDISDILLLSFNKKAAKEMNERIIKFGINCKRENSNLLKFENALTFHSLAYKVLGKDIEGHKVLVNSMKYTDTKTGVEKEFETNEQLKFIQNCFYDIYQGDVKELMESELANELVYFKKSSYLDDDEKYYEYRKNKSYLAFSGNNVRSKGEKVLIDFLFEHGFDIQYEPFINIGDYLSKPDILCNILKDGDKLLSRDIVIEHWGFDKDDSFKKLPIGESISGEEYAKIRKEKITYWEEEERKGNYYFIQTSAKDLKNKDLFLKDLSSKIYEILRNENLELIKKSKDILIMELRRNEAFIFPFTKKLEHFINKSQQKHLHSSEIDEKVNHISDKQERAFIKIANEVYKKYEDEKKKNNCLDFNQILKLASIKLDKYKCDLDFMIGRSKINLKHIKHLIIDEYQDFSTLFYMLLESILKHNNTCKIFVVGDSWQSINAFAGSELGYFFDFRKYFSDETTTIKKITTNYRSKQKIVEMGNNLMDFEGSGKADWLHGINDGGDDYIYVDIRKFDICENNRINSIFSEGDDSKSLEQAKFIFDNIVKIVNANKGKSIMIISRNNRVFGYKLPDWRLKLYYYYFELVITHSDIDIKKNSSNIINRINELDIDSYNKLDKLFSNNNLEFVTAHKSKGKESDIIILLDISENKYPSKETSLKSDIKYDRLFGITPEGLLKDERRLFYVALTRAKEKIYMLSDNKDNTGLLKEVKHHI